VAWSAARVTDLLAQRLRRRVDGLRAAHGLAPMGCSVNAFMGRMPVTIIPTIRELDYGRRDVPPSVHYVGPCLWHPPDRPEATRWLDELPSGRPWVHVNAPTMEGGEPFLLRAAARGLANSGMEVVGTTGGQRTDLRADTLASNIHLTSWVSHAELLPRCSAVVTSGGTGTIMAALVAGVPLVVVPTTWDKPDNAQRIVEAGVGVRHEPRRCTPERLRRAVDTVLHDPRYRDNAQRIAGLLAAKPGPARAAELLTALASRRPSSRQTLALDGGAT
jgi:MGT family glycosyltransferase